MKNFIEKHPFWFALGFTTAVSFMNKPITATIDGKSVG